jgi:peptidoglycan/xylan/chitin deacetylase (PgdA/CDA1 family)
MAVALVVYARSRYVFPVLMYHSVSPDRKDLLTVSPKTFERQMAFLKSCGYRVLSLEQAAQAMRQRRNEGKALAVTFDDGNEDNYTFAFPVLRKYGFPATIFLIYSKVGTPGFLTWDEIREMAASGLIAFGSHSIHHIPLTHLGGQELQDEVAGSKRLLEEKLGKKVDLFAYPVGNFDARTRAAVRDAGYLAAAATNPGRGAADDDPFIIKRLRISENSRNLFTFWFESSGYYNLVRETRQKKRGEY